MSVCGAETGLWGLMSSCRWTKRQLASGWERSDQTGRRRGRGAGCWQTSGCDPGMDLSEKARVTAGRRADLHVSDFSMLMELRKYCGFSMTGIFVIPMITASGPISEDDGVLLPLET